MLDPAWELHTSWHRGCYPVDVRNGAVRSAPAPTGWIELRITGKGKPPAFTSPRQVNERLPDCEFKSVQSGEAEGEFEWIGSYEQETGKIGPEF